MELKILKNSNAGQGKMSLSSALQAEEERFPAFFIDGNMAMTIYEFLSLRSAGETLYLFSANGYR